jgi:thiamine-monophosphate kinase
VSSEFDLIQRYFVRSTPDAVLGPGDDCALLQPGLGQQLAVSTDMLVAGTHFFANTPPRDLGWKTLAVNVSDLAAMGAKPRWATLAGSLPEADENWISAFADGFFACATAFAVNLVGGDTTHGPLNFCVTVIGEVPPGEALRRDGAQSGDDVWVSGRPGLASLGLRFLEGKVELPELWQKLCLASLHRPRPRVALGLALRGKATAAIDVSDGLLADLGHIAKASGLVADVVLNQLPSLPDGIDRAAALECQLAGGDDYELCFTAPFGQRLVLAQLAAELELPLWRIGQMRTPNSPRYLNNPDDNDPSPSQEIQTSCEAPGMVLLLGPEGEIIDFPHHGYDHFNDT